MGLSLQLFADGDQIEASGSGSVDDKQTAVENFVNLGIGTGEVGTNFVNSKHIFKPDFYGQPAPRTVFESAVMHYRSTSMDRAKYTVWHPDYVVLDTNDSSSGWQWIPGMCATINVPTVDSDAGSGAETCRAMVYARCFTFESGGNVLIWVDDGATTNNIIEEEDAIAYEIAFFLNDSMFASSLREMYLGGGGRPHDATTDPNGPFQWTKKDLGWVIQLADHLDAGINNLGFKIRVYPIGLGSNTDEGELHSKHIIVSGRNFILDTWMR